MFDFDNEVDMQEFKKRLKKARKEKNYTQKMLACKLSISRTSIVNWEGKNNNKLPTLSDFAKICSTLDLDPNYFLGKSNIESRNSQAISEAIGISYLNIRKLRDKNYTNHFINFFLSSSKTQEITNRIKRICTYEFVSEAMETTFSSDARQKIVKASEKFYREVFPLDMNVEKFTEYVKNEITWKPDSISINKLIHSNITENEYNNMLFEYPYFENLTDVEKYNLLISNIAKTGYTYYILKQPIIDLSRNEIIKELDNIVEEFIKKEVINFKNKKSGKYNE